MFLHHGSFGWQLMQHSTTTKLFDNNQSLEAKRTKLERETALKSATIEDLTNACSHEANEKNWNVRDEEKANIPLY